MSTVRAVGDTPPSRPSANSTLAIAPSGSRGDSVDHIAPGSGAPMFNPSPYELEIETMRRQLSSRSRSQLYRLTHGGVPLVAIPGGEIWSHPRHGLVRISKDDQHAAREGRRVNTLPLTRTAASIAAARLRACGMTGNPYDQLRKIASN